MIGVVLDPLRLPQQEALQCLTLHTTAVEKLRHGGAMRSSHTNPVDNCKPPLELDAAPDLVAAARPR